MKYQPGPALPDPVRDDLDRVANALRNPEAESITLAQLNAAPAKYTDGMIVYADGTNWNPGAGEGIYAYYGAAWNKL